MSVHWYNIDCLFVVRVENPFALGWDRVAEEKEVSRRMREVYSGDEELYRPH